MLDPWLTIGLVGCVATSDVKYPTAEQIRKDLAMRRNGYKLTPADLSTDSLAQKAITRAYCAAINLL